MLTRNIAAQTEAADDRRPLGRALLRALDGVLVATLVYALYTTHFKAPTTRARIYDMQAVGNPTAPSPAVWVTLKFKRYPEPANRQRVLLVFTSQALERTLSLDWNYIATHAQAMSPNGMTRMPSPLPPNADPPLGRPIELNVPLPLKERMEKVTREAARITAELYWGDVKQGEVSELADHMYFWKP